MASLTQQDRNYLTNVVGISGVELFWGLGIPMVVESTFLQLFLKNLGASSFAIGMIPAFFFMGSSIFAVISSYYTSRLVSKRRAVIGLHLTSAISFLFFGIVFYIFGKISSIVLIFFISYAVFAICIGMTMPVWMAYLVHLFSDKRSVAGLAIMMICQNAAKLVSSIFLVRIVTAYSFSHQSSAIVFIFVGLAFAAGSLFFLFTREQPARPDDGTGPHTRFFDYFSQNISRILHNRNFRCFLVANLETPIVVAVISFYANYATTYCGIDPAIAAGVFVGCIYIGSICTNILLGPMGYLSLKNKYVFSKTAAVCAVLLLIFFTSSISFFIASFLLGISRGARMIVLAPAVKRLAGGHDATSYFAIIPILELPFSMGLPLVYGKFLDHFSTLQAQAYQWIFSASLGLLVITLIFVFKTDFEASA
ncbi:MAG: MFS transporter [Desulfobacteraceae bacterium]|nr:MFS transporter [Desulfobacteraceae bacterium]